MCLITMVMCKEAICVYNMCNEVICVHKPCKEPICIFKTLSAFFFWRDAQKSQKMD